MPDANSPDSKCTVFKGLATFIELATLGSKLPSTIGPALKYHPYLSLRVRGVVHPIGNQPPKPEDAACVTGASGVFDEQDENHRQIPGWNRVVMVMYRYSPRYLVQVLEHAEENYGDAFGVAVTAQMNMATAAAAAPAPAVQQQAQQPNTTQGQPQNTIAADGVGAGAGPGPGADSGIGNTAAPANNILNNATTVNNILNNAGANAAGLDDEEIERLIQEHLETKLTTDPGYPNMKPEEIMTMESNFHADYELDWADIHYAYAYEGVVCPGGKIMMGRWWRCGGVGAGVGLEIDELGYSVDRPEDDQDDQAADGNASGSGGGDGGGGQSSASGASSSQTSNSAAARRRRSVKNVKLERGPFAFWS